MHMHMYVRMYMMCTLQGHLLTTICMLLFKYWSAYFTYILICCLYLPFCLIDTSLGYKAMQIEQSSRPWHVYVYEMKRCVLGPPFMRTVCIHTWHLHQLFENWQTSSPCFVHFYEPLQVHTVYYWTVWKCTLWYIHLSAVQACGCCVITRNTSEKYYI